MRIGVRIRIVTPDSQHSDGKTVRALQCTAAVYMAINYTVT
jgi:hypothetical protein